MSQPSAGTAAVASSAAQKFSAEELARRAIERHGIEATIWGLPIVNYDLLYQAMLKAGGASNQIVFWSRLPDWKNQTLTPNPDVIYLMPFFDTKAAGPVVMEIPAADGSSSITGSVDDAWQTAIEDVGPAGVDKGQGGKYLLLPPDYKEKVPAGYIPLPSSTYRSYALLRSNLASGSDADIAKAVAYGKRVKVHPLSQAANPANTVFIDAIDLIYDNTIPYDLRFFESLDRMVQYEPWLERDKAMIEPLKSIGIEKGKSFQPSATAKQILNAAIAEANAYLSSLYEHVFEPSFDPSARWALPASQELLAGLQSNYTQPGSYPIEARGILYSMGYFSAKHLGAGQFYLMTIKDKAGNALDGAQTYRMRVPANAPVKLYWSATIYDRATHALIRDMKWSSRSSKTPGLQKNADGSVDVYFAPKAPAGKDANWVPTKAPGGFEVLFRLYGPEKDFFDKKWLLPDIEKVQ